MFYPLIDFHPVFKKVKEKYRVLEFFHFISITKILLTLNLHPLILP